MSLFGSIKISAQGLSVQRQRMQLVASNLANVSTTQTPEGGPYLRRQLIVEAQPISDFGEMLEGMGERDYEDQIFGARATEIQLDPSPPRQKYEPGHPDADARGYVLYPNINPAIEMTDMVNITRSYEANVAAVRSAQEMAADTMDLLLTRT